MNIYFEIIIYVTIVFLLVTMSYNQGEWDGMKTLCKGNLYNQNGEIVCLYEQPEQPYNFKPISEVYINGSYEK